MQKLGKLERSEEEQENGELTPSQGKTKIGNDKGMNIQGKIRLAPSQSNHDKEKSDHT